MEVKPENDGLVYLSPAVPAERMLQNMRSAIARNLPQVSVCKAHGLTMSVAGGGPSLADTYKELDGFICAVNGSLKFLLDREIKPGASYACGICDAGEHIADMIVADSRVRYYVASTCDPSVFDKLSGCDVRLWHLTPDSLEHPEWFERRLNNSYNGRWTAIGGGCTMGLRWLMLGYSLGFRKFHLHGLDSSFRDGATHAYPDRADKKDRIKVYGRETRPNFLAQVYDFFVSLETLSSLEPTEITVHGDGLLQDFWIRHQRSKQLVVDRANELLKRLPEGEVRGAEVGVFSGRMSKLLLERPDLCLMMVDSWEGFGAAYGEKSDWHARLTQKQQDDYMKAAIRNTQFADNRRLVLRERSLDVAASCEPNSLDFVFLDADHSQEAVRADIAAWWPAVKGGGLLGGHDYCDEFPGVQIEVDDFARKHGLSVHTGADNTWFLKKQ